MRFGRIYKGVVVEVTEPPPGHSIEQHVGIDQSEFYEEIPDEVDLGYFQQFDGTWLTPEQRAAKKAKGVTPHVQVP